MEYRYKHVVLGSISPASTTSVQMPSCTLCVNFIRLYYMRVPGRKIYSEGHDL